MGYRRYGNGRRYGSEPRFSDFGEMVARFDSKGCSDTHDIKRGDVIGYSRRFRRAICAACWARWVAENREADLIESGGACGW